MSFGPQRHRLRRGAAAAVRPAAAAVQPADDHAERQPAPAVHRRQPRQRVLQHGRDRHQPGVAEPEQRRGHVPEARAATCSSARSTPECRARSRSSSHAHAIRAVSISLTAADASAWPRPAARSACQVSRSIIARTTARSAGASSKGARRRVDERGERWPRAPRRPRRRSGGRRARAGSRAAPARRARRSRTPPHEPLDALGRGRERPRTARARRRDPGSATTSQRDRAAGRDELVERGEVAVDGADADARARRDVVPARRGDAPLGVQLAGRVDDPPPRLARRRRPACSCRNFAETFA